MYPKFSRRTAFQLGLPLYMVGCGADDKPPGSPDENELTEHRVTIFSWWVAAGEADALQALVDVHTAEYPHETIYNAAVDSGTTARVVLAEELALNRPPDLFQENAYGMAAFLDKNPGGLVSLTKFITDEGLFDAVVPQIIEKVTLDGEIYSMPVNIHRENALHYNKRIFDELGLELPTTLDELFQVCDAVKAAGITPIAISHDGWVLRILFNALASASMGPPAFRSYFEGESAFDEAAMGAAVDLLDRVLTSYVNDSASQPNFGWTDAAELLLDGKAAMFIHGDWAKGYLMQLGWEPGTGFGVVGMPAGLFLYGVDVFALPVGGPELAAAKDFLRTVASKAGQTAFNAIKGSSPIRLDTNPEDLDVVARATIEDLRNAKLRMLTRSKDIWDAAFADFATSHDKQALLATYIDNPPTS